MKIKLKTLFAGIMLPAVMLFTAGCKGDPTPYEVNDSEGYTVSVRYDANGGSFATNTMIITDSFNISEMQKNPDGTVEIALLAPDDGRRGNSNSFTPFYSEHFLVGYYSERTESKDSDGNTVYSYSGRWDFDESTLKLDSSKKYSAAEPVMTLYAAWVPMFKVNVHDLESGELISSISLNPNEKSSLKLPTLDEQGVSVVMNDVPARNGYTFDGAYLDAEGKNKIEGDELLHTGKVLPDSGTAENTSMDIYVSWVKGEIFNIYTAEQFISNYKPGGTYIIHEDLDFTDLTWPSSLTTGSFSGKIEGNGHSFKNVVVTQNDNSKTSFGLFGQIGADAVIKDISFENASLTIAKGIRTPGSNYGFFAGSVSEGASVEAISFKECVMNIDSGCYFGTDDYSLGTVCGTGKLEAKDDGIRCELIGDNPERFDIAIDNGVITITENE